MSGSLAEAPSVNAWIEVTPLNGLIRIIPYCRSDDAITVNYELTSEKSGRSGTSRSRQRGKVELKPGIDTSLSHQKIGITEEDRYRLTLKVFSRGHLIASDIITVPES